MSYLGDFRLGETFDTKFCTVNTSGVPTQLAGTPVISAYPGNSTTQLTAGITLTVDFDTVTGLNNVRVVATSGNGYATATNYQLVITTGTVSGSSVVGYVVAEFSIENRSALMPTTAARTLDVSAGGEAGVDWANVGTPGSTVSLSATTVATVTTATTATNVTTVNGLAANVITATAINTGAITAAKFAAGAIDAAAIATGAIDADALAADASAEIADAVWDEDATAHQTQGTFGQAIGDPVADTNTIYKAVVTDATGATVGVDVAAVLDDTGTAGVVVAAGSKTGYSLTATTGLGNQTADITGNLSGSVGSVTGAVGSVTAGVTVTTNNDKTGYRLSATGVDDVWDEPTAGHVTAGTTGVALTDILTDTAEIGAAGAGLTNINLPDQTMNITGNITGDLSGSVGSVTGAVGSVTGNVGGNVTGSVGSVVGLTVANLDTTVSSRATPAQVNTEVLDVLNTDTFAEPGQEAPGATVSLARKIGYLYKFLRNKITQTSTTLSVYNDAETVVDQKATVSDDGVTYTRGEIGTGP